MSHSENENPSFELVPSNSSATCDTSYSENPSSQSIEVIYSENIDDKIGGGKCEEHTLSSENKLNEVAISKINEILIKHSEINEEIKRFNGSDLNNAFEQPLTILLYQLDDINTNGDDTISLIRGNGIIKVKESIKQLNEKARLLENGAQTLTNGDKFEEEMDIPEIKIENEEKLNLNNSEIPNSLLKDITMDENLQSSQEDETTKTIKELAWGMNNEAEISSTPEEGLKTEPKIDKLHVNRAEENAELPDPERMATEMKSQIGPLQPLQLLRRVDSGFELDEKAVKQMLCAEHVRNRKIVVVSVVGAYRRGKSFLLNFMLRYLKAKGAPSWMRPEDGNKLEGFSWRGGSTRDTTGVLIWPEAFLVGDDLAVVLLDTQGTFDSETTLQENAFIFALSTLLSSVQIFNLSERLQMDDLSNLQYFTEIGRMIQKECDTKAFQNLIFLIRDWRYPDENFYGKSGGDGVLKTWFKKAEGSATKQQAEMIEMCFNDILCFLMPNPGEVVSNSRNYQGSLEDMKPEFVQYLDLFINMVLAPPNLVAKQVGQQVILAGDFVSHMSFCVTQLRKPDLQAKTFFESMSETSHKKVVRDVTERYAREFRARMYECDDIHVLHEVLQQRALQSYDSVKKFGSKAISAQYKVTLQEDLRETYYRFAEDYKRICTKQAEEIRSTAETAFTNYHTTIAAFCESSEPGSTLQEAHVAASQESVALLNKLSNKKRNENKLQAAVNELEKKIQSTFEMVEPIYKKLRLYESQVSQATSERDLVSALERALLNYRAVMEAQCSGDRVVEDLKSLHEAAKSSATEIMSGRVVNYDPEISQPFVTKLTEDIEERYVTYTCQNERLRALQQRDMQFSLSDAVEKYRKQMINMGARSSAEFEASHLAAKDAALKEFSIHEGLVEPQQCELFLEKAKSEIQDIYNTLKELNEVARKKEREVQLQRVHYSAVGQYNKEMATLFTDNEHVTDLEERHNAAMKRVHKLYEEFDPNSVECNKWTGETDEAITTEFNDLKKNNENLRIIAENKILVDAVTECRNFYQNSMDKKCKSLKSNSGIDNVHNKYFLTALNMFEEKNDKLKDSETYHKYYEKLQLDIQNCKNKFIKYMSKLERSRTNQLKEAVKFAVSGYRKEMQKFIPNAEKAWYPKLQDLHEEIKNIAHESMMEKYRQIKGVISEHEDQINLEFQKETEILWKKYEELNNVYGEHYRTLLSNTVKSAYRESLLKYQHEMKSSIHSVDGLKLVKLHEIWHDQCTENFQKITEKFTGEFRDEYLVKLKNDIQAQFEVFEEERSKHLRKIRQEENKSESLAIGIDLGTTYICAAVYRDDQVEIIENVGLRTMPSAVYFDDKSQKFGENAIYLGYKDSKNCVSEVKRIIGRKFSDPVVQSVIKQWDFNVEDENGEPVIVLTNGEKKRWRPEEVSALLLGEVKRLAEACLGSKVHDAVVTIPAYFNEPQRRATKEACALAGLNVLRMFNEPTAAAIAYGLQNKCSSSRKILVFDFGGGTCDVSILVVEGEKFEVKASSGDNELGGEDIDNLITKHIEEKFQQKHEINLANWDYRRLRHQCEKLKRILSDKTEYYLQIDKFSDKNILFEYKIYRTEFDIVNKALFQRILSPVAKCLEEAELEKKDIDEIVLAGGSSKIPKVREILSNFFQEKILNSSINADEAIAYGAAIQAAILTNKHKGGLKISDITPFSLGTDIVLNKMEIIIPKNTIISCSKTSRFCTVLDKQTTVDVEVYQGENTEDKKKNTLLGAFKLSGLKEASAGKVSVDVTFELDLNGILQVTAKEVGKTDNIKSIKIERVFN